MLNLRTTRRRFIESGLAVLAMLGIPAGLRAGAWPESAFEATTVSDALLSLFGTESIVPSGDIDLAVPLVAEDGKVVPISVATQLPDVESISIVVEKNPRPLTAHFELAPGTVPEIDTRIKMAETSDVLAIVETAGGRYSTAARVKVTLGGCA